MKTLLIALLLVSTPCASVFAQGPFRNLSKVLAKQVIKRSSKKAANTLKARMKATRTKAAKLAMTGDRIELLMQKTAAKDLLARRYIYNQEIQHMAKTLPQVQALATAPNTALLATVKTLIQDKVINQTLKTTLLSLMAKRKYTQMAQELADYYAVPLDRDLLTLSKKSTRELMVESALRYAKRHPHKPNLPLRELLKSSKVSPRTKANIQRFLDNSVLLNQFPDEFRNFVRSAHKQHYKGLRQALNAKEIQTSIQTYNQTIEELSRFVAKNKRQPWWNSNQAERNLYNKIQLLVVHNVTNTFYEAEVAKQKIRNILAKYPHRSFEAFYKDYSSFIKTNHRKPEMITVHPKASKRERQLYEEMMYFTIEGKLK